MKIIELKSENIKNLKAIEIKPNKNEVILTGKNGAGKSAILDSIFMALTGKKIEQPIRNGEKRAEINVDVGEYRVKKVFTEKGERLEVFNKDGAKFSSPQQFLNNILGKLSFDPLAFSQMKPEKQKETLSKIVNLDFSDLEKRKISLYNERTIKNRELNTVEGQLSALKEPQDNLPAEEISLSDEMDKLRKLENKQKVYLDFEKNKEQQRENIAKNIKEVKQIDEDLLKLQKKKDNLINENKKIEKTIKENKNPEKITYEQIEEKRNKLKEIDSKNIEIRKAQQYMFLNKKVKKYKEESENFTSELDKIDKEKESRITKCKFPLEGLTIVDSGVNFCKKPFAQLSTGEQIKISTAIAMKLNPKLKIILIREGSLLDKKGLNSIIAIAKDNDYQIWIEKVSDDNSVGIYIEDGKILQ